MQEKLVKTIWQNWCSAQLYHSKIEKETLSLSQFSLVSGFFCVRERKYFTYILGLAEHLQMKYQ